MRSNHFLITMLVIVSTVFIPLLALSQNVGIGTDIPLYKLDVRNGSINTDSVYRIEGLTVLSTKNNNLFIGQDAGSGITTGYYNTAVGKSSLNKTTDGIQNTAIGLATLRDNTTGTANTATGNFALANTSIGSYNTAIGSTALASNTTGNYNSASGYRAMYTNESGSYNTASGTDALLKNTTGDYNSATGSLALTENTVGSYNTANGAEALRNNISGDFNAALGYLAAFSAQTGLQNTAVGYRSMFANVNGSGNVAIGSQALSTGKGSVNVVIGYGADVSSALLGNTIAIGGNTIVSASNTARFGNSSTVSYGGWAGWTNVSDGRFKKNIKENVPGLEFINKLRPVTYNLDATRLNKFYHKNTVNKTVLSKENEVLFERGLKEKEKIIYTGFVAQEVEATAKQMGFDFSGVDAAKNENDTYGLRYAEFVVPLVKAVQEQQTMIDALKKQNELLLQRIEQLENKR